MTAEEYLTEKGIHPKEPVFWYSGTTYLTMEDAMQEYANQQTKESLSTIRSLALQLNRKGVKSLIEEIDKMIYEL